MKKSVSKWIALLLSVVMIVMCAAGCSKTQTQETATDDTTDAPAQTADTPAQADEPEQADAPAQDEPVTITFWHTYGDSEEAQFLNVVMPLWESLHPEIKVEAVRQDSSQYHQMIVTSFGTGMSPDVARVDIANIAAYAKQGGLAALSDYPDFAELSASYLDAPLSTNLYQGKYYGLPLDTNCKAAVVNTNVLKELGLDEIPATMEEFIEAAKTRGTYSLNVSGVGDWDMYPYFWLFGGVLTDDGFTKASGYLDSDASIAAMQKIVELHDEKVFTIRDVDGSVDAWDGINSEYAMFFEGPWYFGSYEDSLSKGITAATIPTYEGRSASVVGGEDIAVFATSAHPEAAYEFAKFMTSEDVQLAMLEAGDTQVPRGQRRGAEQPRLVCLYAADGIGQGSHSVSQQLRDPGDLERNGDQHLRRWRGCGAGASRCSGPDRRAAQLNRVLQQAAGPNGSAAFLRKEGYPYGFCRKSRPAGRAARRSPQGCARLAHGAAVYPAGADSGGGVRALSAAVYDPYRAVRLSDRAGKHYVYRS